MALKLIYLVVRSLLSWIRLSRQDAASKNVEILMLRHQLAVAQRRDPRVARKLTWADRAWLALLAGLVPAERLSRIRLLVTPGTVLRWHRDLLGRRWARRSRRPPGRPSTHRNIKVLVIRMAKENPGRGYPANPRRARRPGHRRRRLHRMGILKAAGIDPASQQNTGPTWAAFLRSQAEAILACDFVVVDLLDGSKAYVLAVIERATRRVRVLDHVPYLPEKHITAKLPLLHHLLTTHAPAMDDTSATASAATSHTPATTPQEVIDCLRTHGLALAYDPRTRTLEISGKPAARTTI